ncbi:MAG: hypothetical protein IT279_00315 [Ignavibacteriaceae bacterium]|nr:hypothetical protein [Ignavibacteriaceae bacterium]
MILLLANHLPLMQKSVFLDMYSFFAFVRRGAVLLLLSVLLFNSAGFVGAFYFAKAKIKKEIKMKLKGEFPKDQLKLITIDSRKGEDKLLRWIEPHEFMLNGRMYDIIKTDTMPGGVLHYLCIDDEDETLLFANMDELIKQEFQRDRNKRGNAVKNLEKMQMEYFLSALKTIYPAEHTEDYGAVRLVLPANYIYSPLTPPPRYS